MKETIPLSPNGNGDGSDGTGSASASGADSRSSSDDATRLGGIASESGARSGTVDDGSDELPLGDGGYKRKRKRSAVTSERSASVGVDSLRIGGRGSGGSRSRTDTDSTNASTSAEEGEASGASGIPREIAIESLGKSKEKKEKYTPNTNLSSEFIAEGIGLLFHAAAILLNDDEWKLPEEDATELAERTKKWARQGSKSIAAFEKRLARWEPMMMLIFGLAAVILPRIIHTRVKRNALRTPQKEAAGSGTNKNGTAPIASVQGSNGGNAAGDAARRGVDVGSGSATNGAEIIPFRRQDWREIPGIDD